MVHAGLGEFGRLCESKSRKWQFGALPLRGLRTKGGGGGAWKVVERDAEAVEPSDGHQWRGGVIGGNEGQSPGQVKNLDDTSGGEDVNDGVNDFDSRGGLGGVF